jgi:GNAT superfamily N-acetyltransferase
MTIDAQRITIRGARPSDKKVVLGFCRHTWGEWGDYIDKVWDEWVKDKNGFFAVASLGGRPVGTAKLTVLNKREVWFEGLRVDPSFRGMGLSHLLTGFLARMALRRGAETVRYATGARNRASLHIGKSWGLRPLGRYSILSATCDGRRRQVFERLSDPLRALTIIRNLAVPIKGVFVEPMGLETRFKRASIRLLLRDGSKGAGKAATRETKAERKRALDEVVRVVSSAPLTKAMGGLASEGWTFFQVDTDFLAASFDKGEVFLGTWANESAAVQSRQPGTGCRKGPDRGWLDESSATVPLGILIASPQRSQRRLLVKLVAELSKDALGPLLSGTRRLAHQLDLPRVRLIVPATRTMLACAKRAGFKEEDEGFYHVVMEMHLEDKRTRARVARRVDRYL